MFPRIRRWAVCLPMLLSLASCSSGTEPELILDPSPSELVGSYALTGPLSFSNGTTVVADTLALSEDGSFTRRQLARGPGPVGDMLNSGLGTYTVDPPTVALAFSCTNGVCFGTSVMYAAAMGRKGRVTRLLLPGGDQSMEFDRIP